MKISTILFAFLLFLSVSSAFKIVTTFYTDDKCTKVNSDMPAVEIDGGKSGQCINLPTSDSDSEAGFAIVSSKTTIKGNSGEYW